MVKVIEKPTLDLSGGVAARLRTFIGALDAPGHTIYPAADFEEASIPAAFWKDCLVTHKSDRSDPKHTITSGGRTVDAMKGVYGLNWLRWLADRLNVQHDGRQFSGRGTQAREIAAALVQYLSTVEVA